MMKKILEAPRLARELIKNQVEKIRFMVYFVQMALRQQGNVVSDKKLDKSMGFYDGLKALFSKFRYIPVTFFPLFLFLGYVHFFPMDAQSNLLITITMGIPTLVFSLSMITLVVISDAREMTISQTLQELRQDCEVIIHNKNTNRPKSLFMKAFHEENLAELLSLTFTQKYDEYDIVLARTSAREDRPSMRNLQYVRDIDVEYIADNPHNRVLLTKLANLNAAIEYARKGPQQKALQHSLLKGPSAPFSLLDENLKLLVAQYAQERLVLPYSSAENEVLINHLYEKQPLVKFKYD